MENQNQRGFFGIIIPKDVLDDKDLTIGEKFIYGYIASFNKCCFESNKKIAEKLGLSESMVKHAIPKLVAKRYLYVEKINNNDGSRRVYAVLDNPKKLDYLMKKGLLKPCGKPVENSGQLVQNLHTLVQNLHTPLTGKVSAKFAHIDKEEIKNKVEAVQKPNNPAAGFASKLLASRLTRTDYNSDDDYEAAFYKRNTICLDVGQH